MPWMTPADPATRVAALCPLAGPSPPASQPISRTASSGMNAWNTPIAFDPPPTQAITASGSRPAMASTCSLRLHPDDPLEVAHHGRERVRAHHRADAVVAGVDRGHPVAERLVDGVLERPAARRDRHHLGAEQPHPGHVQRLPLGVLLAHVDDAVQAEQRAGGRGGYAVLAGAGLGDHPLLAHPLGQQRLPKHIIDLVRAGVRQVLPLEQDPAVPGPGREPRRLGQQRRPPGIAGQQGGQLGPERRVGLGRRVLAGQVVQRGHQRLRREPAAVRAEVPWLAVRPARPRCRRRGGGWPGHPRSPRSAGCEPAVTRSATALRGSLPVTRLSPTSTASAPAAA